MDANEKELNQNNNYDKDRISDLPDFLLHRILSSLDTKVVVQSSVFSTRWKHLWTHIPFLNFTFSKADCLLPSSSPSYAPTAVTALIPSSPTYRMSSPHYCPRSPFYDPTAVTVNTPSSPAYSCCYMSSPPYCPRSPFYDPTAVTALTPSSPSNNHMSSPPTYTPPSPCLYCPPSSPAYSPTDPILEDKIWRFNKFVYQVLNRRGATSKIDKFKFRCDVGLDINLINYILFYVVRAKIQDVEFHAETYNISQLMELPECLYVSQSLKKLHLGIPCVNLSNGTGFLALKELWLHGLSSDIPQIISPEFFSNCPALENLSFSDCRLCFSVLTISAPMLKKLEILNSSFDQVVVSSPLLTSFIFEGSDPINLFIDDKCMLEQVDINVKADGRDEEKKATQLLGMLKELANAKYVVVSLDTLKVLSAARNRLKSEPSPFPFLKALKLKTDWSMTRDGWDFLLKDSASDVETSIQLPFPLPRLTRKRFRTF